MKKTLLCNIRMSEGAEKKVYASEDKYIPVSDTPVCYPVMAFLEKVLKEGDEVRVLMLAKDDGTGRREGHIKVFQEELDYVAAQTGARFSTETISTPFREDAETHGDLMMQLIDRIDQSSEIIMDMTYGPKDQVLVEFSALNFAHRYLDCEVGEILYGQVVFIDGKATDPRICEMGSLFYLNSLISDVKSNDPEKAKEMLKVLLDK